MVFEILYQIYHEGKSEDDALASLDALLTNGTLKTPTVAGLALHLRERGVVSCPDKKAAVDHILLSLIGYVVGVDIIIHGGYLTCVNPTQQAQPRGGSVQGGRECRGASGCRPQARRHARRCAIGQRGAEGSGAGCVNFFIVSSHFLLFLLHAHTAFIAVYIFVTNSSVFPCKSHHPMLPLSLVAIGLSLLAYAAYSIITCTALHGTCVLRVSSAPFTDRDVLKLSQQELDQIPQEAKLLIAVGTVVASLGTAVGC